MSIVSYSSVFIVKRIQGLLTIILDDGIFLWQNDSLYSHLWRHMHDFGSCSPLDDLLGWYLDVLGCSGLQKSPFWACLSFLLKLFAELTVVTSKTILNYFKILIYWHTSGSHVEIDADSSWQPIHCRGSATQSVFLPLCCCNLVPFSIFFPYPAWELWMLDWKKKKKREKFRRFYLFILAALATAYRSSQARDWTAQQ